MFKDGLIVTLLERIKDLVEGEDRAVKALEREVELLREQNQDLFAKLMARDWSEYVLGTRVGKEEKEEKRELAPEEDEENAGVAMEIGGPDDSGE